MLQSLAGGKRATLGRKPRFGGLEAGEPGFRLPERGDRALPAMPQDRSGPGAKLCRSLRIGGERSGECVAAHRPGTDTHA
ncbi:MAG: hypothetical protein ACJ8ER_01510 [Allosphingosinicella sp.]